MKSFELEILIAVTKVSFFGVLLACPFFFGWVLRKLDLPYRILLYSFLGIIVSSVLIITLAWWVNYSNQLLLVSLGYDESLMTEEERYKNVNPKNTAQVENLLKSLGGIGWPIKAIFAMVAFSPILTILYILSYYSINYFVLRNVQGDL